MESNEIYMLEEDIKVGFVLTIGEKVFSIIKNDDERYLDGRDALDKCWAWVENKRVSGDDLYELIDNAECTGISEFAEDEEDLEIARLWSLLVDIVSYTAWKAYKREKTIYLPQALEGIKEESVAILIESAIETTFITKEKIQLMEQRLLNKLQVSNDKTITRYDFMTKILSD
ncbi:Imm6 family immunity protein [Heyndrickxia sporothermodurans]